MTGVDAVSGAGGCPRCGMPLIGGGVHVAWCRGCGWNVALHDGGRADGGRTSSRRQVRTQRAAHRLFESLRGRTVTRPGWTWRRALSYALALVVHLVSLSVAVAGVALVVSGLPSIVVTGSGLVLLAIGAGLRPRFGRVPTTTRRLRREEAPETWRLIDHVAAAAHVAPPHVLLVTSEVNACVTAVGVRRRRVLVLGLGLHALLTPQELAAVLGHEVAHTRNGDVRHGFLVGSAMEALATWEHALRHRGSGGMVDGFAALAAWVAELVMAVLRLAPLGLFVLLERLQLAAGQRAEYLADQVAAEVAGTEAAAGALEGLLLAEPAWNAMQRAAVRDEADLFAAAHALREDQPPTELERRARAARAADVAADATHPPTMLRVDLVRSRPDRPAAVHVDHEWSVAINHELAPARDELTPRLRDELVDPA